MRRSKIRIVLSFLAGAAVTVGVVAFAGGVRSVSAARYDQLSLFTSVLNLVRKNYVESIDERKLIQGAVRGMLRELDPHSSYLDPDAHKEMQVDTRGQFHGLGIEISKRRDGFIEVVAPIDGTPAARAGIRARDQIVSICPIPVPDDWEDEECRPTKGMTLFDAVKLMRGPRGSKITIRIFREGFDSPQPYTIVRDVVKVVSVDGRIMEPGYAYLRVRSFQERTVQDLEATLEALHEENDGDFDGLVIDLRDNPGGLLDQAVKVADLWLEDGLIVYTKGRVDSQRQDFKAKQRDEGDYPIVVLVNGGSASASEIVAGAIQDLGRGVLIGERTFGKGSVQLQYDLSDGSILRVTYAAWFTPDDRAINGEGIKPDLEVAAPDEGGTDTQLAAALSYLHEQRQGTDR